MRLEECAALSAPERKHALAEALNELCLAQALELTPEGYRAAHDGFHAAQSGTREASAALCMLLADLGENGGCWWRAIRRSRIREPWQAT